MKTEEKVCVLELPAGPSVGTVGTADDALCEPQKIRPVDFDAASQSSLTSVVSTDTGSTEGCQQGRQKNEVKRSSLRKIPRTIQETKPVALVVVDPWSTGDKLCREINNRGHEVIVVWEESLVRSTELPASEVVLHREFEDTAYHIKEVLSLEYDIKGIVPGSETGVLLAEQLAHTLGFPTNPPELAQARRNKYLMGETLRQRGVRAVQQTITTDLEEAKAFIRELNPSPFRVILKPNMGAGSDDVHLCKSMEEVEQKFQIVNGKLNSLGYKNDGVLVQEFLSGTEYVIDSVSRNGQHQVVSLWVYDKREVNGRFNVYFGSYPMVNDSALSQCLIDYLFQVLDALEFVNGPAHAEIMMTPSGPCLVEIGARCHGGGGTWVDMAQSCWRVDQLSTVIDTFTTVDVAEAKEDFEFGSFFTTKFHGFGAIVDFVQYEEGELVEIAGDEFVRNLPSFSSVYYCVKVGDQLVKTVDCNTTPGQLILIHPDEQQVRHDFEFVHALLRQKDGYFKLKRD